MTRRASNGRNVLRVLRDAYPATMTVDQIHSTTPPGRTKPIRADMGRPGVAQRLAELVETGDVLALGERFVAAPHADVRR